MKRTELKRKTALQPKRRPRKCRSCGEPYTPRSTTQRACSPRCALKLAGKEREKRERAAAAERRKLDRLALERLKSRSDHMREAQVAFNAWVRERDHGRPCVSCDRPDDGRHQRHASHYRSRGACPELAFEPLNVHASCAQCNSMKSGNIVEYRIRLRERIGDDALEWLEGPHPAPKYTIEELNEIKARYRRLTRELKKRRTE
ncbi:MAG: recombination protein NinG [Verrucomicrobiota bacterium JB024]|nr:recombination protein NinG [Verrucomicrobiota bacterium JB024]